MKAARALACLLAIVTAATTAPPATAHPSHVKFPKLPPVRVKKGHHHKSTGATTGKIEPRGNDGPADALEPLKP